VGVTGGWVGGKRGRRGRAEAVYGLADGLPSFVYLRCELGPKKGLGGGRGESVGMRYETSREGWGPQASLGESER
jgi:hypothetical protein